MSFKVKLPLKPLNRLLKKTLSPYLNRRFNIRYHLDEAVSSLKPPFAIVANHQTNWDAFILSYKIKEPVSFVASAQQFRSPFMRFVMGLAGSIPKTKSMSDSTTVRGIFKVRDMGGIVGIFPEGKRCWDGRTEEILYPTAKVLKQLKIPIVSVRFQGGHLSFPRWAKESRKGELLLTYKLLASREEVTSLTSDGIYKRMTEALQINEYSWQSEKMIPYNGKNLAEHLELCLFLCPICRTVGKLYSKGDVFTCTHCGEAVRYNSYGFFEKEDGVPHFHSVDEWNQWQLSEVDHMISERIEKPGMPLFEDPEVTLYSAEAYGPLKKIGTGVLRLFVDGIAFEGNDGTVQKFCLEGLNGVSTHLSDRFDFYYHQQFYRVSFPTRHVSANKWSEAYDRIQKVIEKKHS